MKLLYYKWKKTLTTKIDNISSKYILVGKVYAYLSILFEIHINCYFFQEFRVVFVIAVIQITPMPDVTVIVLSNNARA